MSRISAPIARFKQREPTPRQPTQSPYGTPQLQLQVPTPGVTRANTTGGDLNDRLTDSEETRVLEDVQPFSSSPKAGLAELPTVATLPSQGDLPSAPSIKVHIPDAGQQNIISPPGTRMFSPQSILSVQSDFGIPLHRTKSPPAVEFAAMTSSHEHPRRYDSLTNMRGKECFRA